MSAKETPVRKITRPLQVVERSIKRRLAARLRKSGFSTNIRKENIPTELEKDVIRFRHLQQRNERLTKSATFITESLGELLNFFAAGTEIEPEKITPRLQLIASGTMESRLFRLASLTWSIPVSEGYGRRMRFLVWDESNGKLIGLMAIGDPVFNLHVRDNLVGWDAAGRKDRLVNIMDAYVLGALPPYNQLLAGKLIACLVRTKEVRDAFDDKYGMTKGIISGERKHAKLVMVTTTSALGRSSVYNRLRLAGTQYFEPIGFTAGFGHFHVPADLFADMRNYLRKRRNSYSDGNRYGNGPNWKFRTIRAALEMMGTDRDVLHHGIRREVFTCRLAENAYAVLRGEASKPCYSGLLTVKAVSKLTLDRWVLPRALRRPDFVLWKRNNIIDLLTPGKVHAE